METVCILLCFMAMVQFALQLSLFRSQTAYWISLAVGAAFCLACYPYAIEESYKQFSNYLRNQVLMQNLTVLIYAEAFIGILLTRWHADAGLSKAKSRRYWTWVQYLPGLLFFPALYFLNSMMYLLGAGISLPWICTWLCLAFLGIGWGVSRFFSWNFPKAHTRQLLKYGLHALQLLVALGIGISFTQAPLEPAQEHISLDWVSYGLVLMGVGLLLASGYLLQGYKIRKTKRILKTN